MKYVFLLLMLTASLLSGMTGCSSDSSAPLSSAKTITAFTLNGAAVTIDEANKTIEVTMPFGTDATSLTPAITHTGASISPLSGVAKNFLSSVNYTVTAADGSTATYTVTVRIPKGLLKTGQTTSFAAGDDGDLQKGVAWPSPRFTDNGDSTVTDNATGLMWTQDGNAPGPVECLSSGATMTWQEALDYMECLNTNVYLGHNDWRLPNVNEMKSLVHYGQTDTYAWLNDAAQGFSNVQGAYYWTSTTCQDYVVDTYAWMVSLYGLPISQNGVFNDTKVTPHYVWPVRDGITGTITLPKSGQTSSFGAAGSDGYLQKGATWPATRFIDNVTTMTDTVTGLMWTNDGDAPGPPACNPGITMNTADALTYIACLNANAYLGHTDWRLPNVNELASLVNRGVQSPETGASWLNSQGFTNVQPAWYRSSTTNAGATSYAWVVNIGNGNIFSDGQKSSPVDHIWPVRDSQP